MTAIALNPFVTYTDTSGSPLAGGKIYTYIAGTTTPQATYTDATQVTPAANPIILDAAGRSPYGAIWGNGSYKLRITTSADVDIYTVDNVQISGTISSGTTVISGALSVAGLLTASGGIISNGYGVSTVGRNKIINGDMLIDQRNAGASQTITAAAALAYTVDRWYAYCTGANVTSQRVAGSLGSQYRYQFTGAASVTAIGFAQRVESFNAVELQGNTATLSVDLANSLLTSVTWTAYYANTADTFGSIASPTRTQIATGTFTVTSTITNYSTQISMPTNAANGVEIVFTVGAQVSGTFTIGKVQLELGSVASSFENLSYSQKFLNCFRYYQQYQQPCLKGTANSTSTVARMSFALVVRMRAVPTSVVGAHTLYDGSVNPTILSTGSTNNTVDVLEVDITASASTLTTGRPVSVIQSGSTITTLSAEIP